MNIFYVILLLKTLTTCSEAIRESEDHCLKQDNYEACLSGGEEDHEGNVYVDGRPICDDNWDKTDGDVV